MKMADEPAVEQADSKLFELIFSDNDDDYDVDDNDEDNDDLDDAAPKRIRIRKRARKDVFKHPLPPAVARPRCSLCQRKRNALGCLRDCCRACCARNPQGPCQYHRDSGKRGDRKCDVCTVRHRRVGECGMW